MLTCFASHFAVLSDFHVWFCYGALFIFVFICATFTFICLIPGDYDNETDDVDQNEIDNSNRSSDNDDGDNIVQQPTTNSAHPSIIDTNTSKIDATDVGNRINEQIDTNEIIGSEAQPTIILENRNEMDIDSMSCDRNNGGCEQTCNMVPGEGNGGNVVECSCNDGFYLDADGGSKCLGRS